ncbi:Molybdenum cofactor synthesis protein 1 [Chytridiales sp. JEL 0842]|nr:Molybdenum cofactor synthesis protein 1 [Chytridiales sp. JEL 0842]
MIGLRNVRLSSSQTNAPELKTNLPVLTDTFNRNHTYLRISLTERCNLRCTYCMPAEGVSLTPSDKLLSTPEILRLAQLFVTAGIKKIRLTGGEPTVRKDLYDVLGLERVLESVDLALKTGFESVKLNVVVMKNVNDSEVVNFVGLTKDKNLYVRFIEYMPFDGTIEQHYAGQVVKVSDSANDTSKAFKVEGHLGKFGFITSMSEHFCGTCNRLRLLADGNMKVCLFGNTEVNLKNELRSGASDEKLMEIISMAVKRKKKQHADKNGSAHMVNISEKSETRRVAVACGLVRFSSKEAYTLLKENAIKKGDVLTVAQIAGINAAKQTGYLIPLAHPIPLTSVKLQFTLKEEDLSVLVTSTVECVGRTGVEVEAVTSVSIAACTIFDMCKAVDKAIIVTDIRVLHKSGGKSGVYIGK